MPERRAKAPTRVDERTTREGGTQPLARQHQSVIETIPPLSEHPPRTAETAIRAREITDTAGLSRAQLHDIYRLLYETRRLEEHLVALARQGQVVGGVYRSLGQEAAAVGCTYGLGDGDIIQPLIRDLGSLLVHGVMPLALFRQYMARETGPSGGRDLNVHFSNPGVGMLGPVSMLGAMVPVIAGCLLAAQLQGREQVGMAFVGDGGSSTGAFYEGLNFAAVRRLPLIVVLEANQYAYSTPTTSQAPDGDLVRRASGFGCTVAYLDGNDVLACYEAARDARQRALSGAGPTVIVAETYRRKGHAEHDNQQYVDPAEIEAWATGNDPVDRYLAFLEQGGHAQGTELEAIRNRIDDELDAARDQAVSEPFPDAATVTHAVFADDTSPQPPTETWFRGGQNLRGGA